MANNKMKIIRPQDPDVFDIMEDMRKDMHRIPYNAWAFTRDDDEADISDIQLEVERDYRGA